MTSEEETRAAWAAAMKPLGYALDAARARVAEMQRRHDQIAGAVHEHFTVVANGIDAARAAVVKAGASPEKQGSTS